MGIGEPGEIIKIQVLIISTEIKLVRDIFFKPYEA